jgi:hypothetical protein
MAIKTFGTNANNSLSALVFVPGYGSGLAPADVATVAGAIKNDQVNTNPMIPFAFSSEGRILIPNRGTLILYPGDYVVYDSTGWPLVFSKNAVANGPYTHS